MPPNEQASHSQGQAQAQVHLDTEDPNHATLPRKTAAATEVPKRQLLQHKRSAPGENKKAWHRYPAGARRAVARPGSQLPRSRISAPPTTQWDFDERQDVRATRDDDSLRRNVLWQWHRTAQRLVFLAGGVGLIFAYLDLVRSVGLRPEAAVSLTLACLLSGTGGYALRGLFTVIIGRRLPRDHRSDDDRSS